MLIAGSTPSLFGGMIASVRMGATAGMGPLGGGVGGVCGGPLRCAVVTGLTGLISSVAGTRAAACAGDVCKAFRSSAESMPLSFSSDNRRSRISPEELPARLPASVALNTPLLTSSFSSGSLAAELPAGAVALLALMSAEASLAFFGDGELLLESDPAAKTGKRNIAKTAGRNRTDI